MNKKLLGILSLIAGFMFIFSFTTCDLSEEETKDNNGIHTPGQPYKPGTYMLTTQWGQGTPYNGQLPLVDEQRTIAGCGPIASAQIMNYHQHPKKMTGEIPAYTTGTLGIEISSVNLNNIIFDWANMKDSYEAGTYTTAEANAVATLISVVGKAARSDYGLTLTGNPVITATVLRRYFDYDNGYQTLYKDQYDGDWDAMLREQIDMGLPVVYTGRNANGSQHSWVLDGYDNDGKFHHNFGHGGNRDGWYFNHDLPAGAAYNNSQRAGINIKPNLTTDTDA